LGCLTHDAVHAAEVGADEGAPDLVRTTGTGGDGRKEGEDGLRRGRLRGTSGLNSMKEVELLGSVGPLLHGRVIIPTVGDRDNQGVSE